MKSTTSRAASAEGAGRTRALRQPSRAARASDRGTVSQLLALQRTHGNGFVQRMLTATRQGGGDAARPGSGVERAIQQARGGGRPLDGGLLQRMEAGFGTSFSGVRIHTDARADALNRALSARAFTTGQDVFFRRGAFSPGEAAGRELLAHELSHVVQQIGTAGSGGVQRMCAECAEEKTEAGAGEMVQPRLMVGAPDDLYEREADAAAGAFRRWEARTGLSADSPLAGELTAVKQRNPVSGTSSGGLQLLAMDTAPDVSSLPAGGRQDRPLDSLGAGGRDYIQRACLPAADCAGPIAGSSTEFGVQEQSAEAKARARRAKQSPARQKATGHTGPAKQLENFLDAQAPGLRANIHGIFVDQDLSVNTGALTMDCAAMVPPITGATKPCVFIHGSLNQEALAFNKTTDATIGGLPREDWRINTVQILTHEIQHVVFDNAARPAPAAAAGCARADVEHELSELNAIMSEFPVTFRAIPAAAPAGDPARVRLDNWFNSSITNPSESIRGILKTMRCVCDCAAVDAWVIDTFNFVSSSWSAAEKTAFNTELRRAVWGLSWPL